MAWNPDPKVAAACDFGKKFGADRVIILFVMPDDEIGYASYGKTPALCAQARIIADDLFDEFGLDVDLAAAGRLTASRDDA